MTRLPVVLQKRLNYGAMGIGVLLLVAVLSALGSSVKSISAQQPVPIITVGFQEEARAGETVALAAYLQDPLGNPIYDAEITFTLDVEFLNVSDTIEIGSAITDEQGLALIEYEPRIEGANNITARFEGNDVFAAVNSVGSLEVVGDGQLYREFRPYRIPGANVWMTTAVITIVWIVFIVSLGVIGWANIKTRAEREGSNV